MKLILSSQSASDVQSSALGHFLGLSAKFLTHHTIFFLALSCLEEALEDLPRGNHQGVTPDRFLSDLFLTLDGRETILTSGKWLKWEEDDEATSASSSSETIRLPTGSDPMPTEILPVDVLSRVDRAVAVRQSVLPTKKMYLVRLPPQKKN
jgi:hypothetical protein